VSSSSIATPELARSARDRARWASSARSKPSTSTSYPALLCHQLGQVEGEAERVVELERLVSGDGPALARRQLGEALHAAFDGLEEALFLGPSAP
jgi:hypothetical protein